MRTQERGICAYTIWGADEFGHHPDGLTAAEPDPDLVLLRRVHVAGTTYITWAFHADPLIREDALDLDGATRGADEWCEWADDVDAPLLDWMTAQPTTHLSEGRFHRTVVRALVDAGCLILALEPEETPTLPRSRIHAIVRGEDVVGWIMSAGAVQLNGPSADQYAPAPTLHDLITRSSQ
jgi:hypothetical protein